MPYEIIIEGRRVIEVYYHNQVDINERIQALCDVEEILRKNQADKRLLINITDIHSKLTTMEQFEFGKKLAESEELQGSRVALLRKLENKSNQFINSVAINRGYYLKEFFDRKEAVRWLKK